MILGAATIRERVKRARIEDPFVVHQFVVFGTGSGAELVLFGIPVHAVGFDDGGDARLLLRRPEFIQRVLLEDLIVELGLSFGVEGETADLTFGFTAGGQVAVFLSPPEQNSMMWSPGSSLSVKSPRKSPSGGWMGGSSGPWTKTTESVSE